MKNLILVLLTLAYPSLALADGWVCDGNSCRYVRSVPAVPAFRATVSYVADDLPPLSDAPLISFASYAPKAASTFYPAPIATNIPAGVSVAPPAPPPASLGYGASEIISVSAPVVTSSTCSCATTGYCTCPPGTCACPGCPSNAGAMAAASYGSAATGGTSTYPTPRGPLEAWVCQYGHVHTSAPGGGAYARQLSRHLHRGYRRFGIQP